MPSSVRRVSSGVGGGESGSGIGGSIAPPTAVLPTKSQSSVEDNASEAATSLTSDLATTSNTAIKSATSTDSTAATAVAITVKQKAYSIKRKTVLRQIATTLGAAWLPEASALSSSSSLSSSSALQPIGSRGRSSTRIRKTTQHFKPTTAPTFTRPSYAHKDRALSTKGRRQRQTRSSQPKAKISKLDQELHDAAHASRLHAHGLCQEEFDIFQYYLRRDDLPAYLAVRNTILSLWRANPKQRLLYTVAFEKTKDLGLHHGLIHPIYEFLVRSGYINFGLFRETAAGDETSRNGLHHTRHVDGASMPSETKVTKDATIPSADSNGVGKRQQQRTIAVIGAGIAGIGCARQLTNLFETYRDRFLPDEPPRVVVLEARPRIGGRMHTVEIPSSCLEKVAKVDISSIFQGPSSGQPAPTIVDSSLPDYTRFNFSHAVDLGAQIITGFENGNPMEIIVRRQMTDLRLYYLGEKPCDLFGPDGNPVDKVVDEECEEIFNDILEKACKLRHTQHWPRPLLEYLKKRHTQASGSQAHQTSKSSTVPSSQDHHRHPRAEHAKQPKAVESHRSNKTEVDNLETSATLGECMDYFVESHPDFGRWTDQELELIHWHYANLEFANATPLDKLSLKNWDQDDDFEFSGQHCMVNGGYGQVPLALSTGIDIQLNKPVAKIRTVEEGAGKESVHIQCRDGSTLDCTAAVITIPLGVLKRGGSSASFAHDSKVSTATATSQDGICFEPDLPDWKRKAIDHLGFGLLNKLVLVFPEYFWDKAVELFGSVRKAASSPESSGTKVSHGSTRTPYRRAAYESSRGKFYMFWNCISVSGLPTLVTLLAGHAAYESEETDKETLVREAVETLERIYPDIKPLPRPVHTIVTRWSADEFARGSYSFVGQNGTGHDYDLLARPIKNQLYFAGEATSRHYPATAHGAYLSGLKVASDILSSLIGPLTVEGSVAAASRAKAEAKRPSSVKAGEGDRDNGENATMEVDYLQTDNSLSSASSPLHSFGEAHTEESPPPDHHHQYRVRKSSMSSSSSAESATNLGHGFLMPRRRWGRASRKMIAPFVADRSHYKYKTGMLASASSSEDEADDDNDQNEEVKNSGRKAQHQYRTNDAKGAVAAGVKRRRTSVTSVSSHAEDAKKEHSVEPARRRPGRTRGSKTKTRGSGRLAGRPRKSTVSV
ncbi:hypothetical protein BGW42_005524 [Actinomortierella wolfii]|nr:hypothetical protein BGW42_005524 [Actinomortierella wolfii]